MKIKDIIKRLQELDDKEYIVEMEVEPIVSCIEQLNGIGWETTKYRYTITLESKEITRKYKNEYGLKKYLDKKGGRNGKIK